MATNVELSLEVTRLRNIIKKMLKEFATYGQLTMGDAIMLLEKLFPVDKVD